MKRQIYIRLNQRRITIQQNAAQISQIINKLSCSREYAETIGVTAGQFDDTANPDEKSNANSGGILRQQKWAGSSPDELNVVHLTGPLITSVSSCPYPFPSEV